MTLALGASNLIRFVTPLECFAILATIFSAWSLALTMIGAALDYVDKKKIVERYGRVLRFGPEHIQCRRIRISSPPEDLSDLVAASLRKISPDVHSIDVQEERITALREGGRGRGPLWRSLIEAKIQRQPDGSATVEVTSRLAPPRWGSGFDALRFDLGRSIENVEEFDRDIRRALSR